MLDQVTGTELALAMTLAGSRAARNRYTTPNISPTKTRLDSIPLVIHYADILWYAIVSVVVLRQYTSTRYYVDIADVSSVENLALVATDVMS